MSFEEENALFSIRFRVEGKLTLVKEVLDVKEVLEHAPYPIISTPSGTTYEIPCFFLRILQKFFSVFGEKYAVNRLIDRVVL